VQNLDASAEDAVTDAHSVETRGDDMSGREDIPQAPDGVSGQDALQGDGSGDPNKDREFLQDLPPAQVDPEQADSDADEGPYAEE
jgi:hypothetical protein